MKAKNLITELSKLDPETEIYTHIFDTYTVTKNFEVTNAFRNYEDSEDPICFVDELDEDFTIPIVILSKKMKKMSEYNLIDC